MHIYHIGAQPYDQIKPKRLQGLTPKELAKIDEDYKEWSTPPYSWSMSFFFDPPPYNEFLYHYDNKDRWKPGSTVYEHTIDLDDIILPCYWRVVESPINTTMLGSIWDSVDDKLWFKMRWELLAVTHHMGFDLSNLGKAVEKYKGTTTDYYRKLWDSENFNDLKDRYAPNVPHLMLWSGNPVKVTSVKKVIIPNKR
jgi:hypothetical protein